MTDRYQGNRPHYLCFDKFFRKIPQIRIHYRLWQFSCYSGWFKEFPLCGKKSLPFNPHPWTLPSRSHDHHNFHVFIASTKTINLFSTDDYNCLLTCYLKKKKHCCKKLKTLFYSSMFSFNLSEKAKHPSQLPSDDNIKNSWNKSYGTQLKRTEYMNLNYLLGRKLCITNNNGSNFKEHSCLIL